MLLNKLQKPLRVALWLYTRYFFVKKRFEFVLQSFAIVELLKVVYYYKRNKRILIYLIPFQSILGYVWFGFAEDNNQRIVYNFAFLQKLKISLYVIMNLLFTYLREILQKLLLRTFDEIFVFAKAKIFEIIERNKAIITMSFDVKEHNSFSFQVGHNQKRINPFRLVLVNRMQNYHSQNLDQQAIAMPFFELAVTFKNVRESFQIFLIDKFKTVTLIF